MTNDDKDLRTEGQELSEQELNEVSAGKGEKGGAKARCEYCKNKDTCSQSDRDIVKATARCDKYEGRFIFIS